ncbi:MAG: putative metalloprotease CJM1_0395 family protein [Pseudomonadota bacterium]
MMSTMIAALQSNTATAPSTTGPASARASESSTEPAKASDSGDSVELSPEALALIAKLKARDGQVRQHEQAHLSVAGSLALSGASYVYQRGPDGVSYAIGGEVQIDTSPGGTPAETIARAQTVMAAALAPADPSGADRAVAAQAQQMLQQALGEQAQQQAAAPPEEHDDGQPASDPRAQALKRAYGVFEAAPATIQVSA